MGHEFTQYLIQVMNGVISLETTLPIIAFSANAIDEDKVLSAEAGMNAHISKPLNKRKLDEVLGKYLK